jgi:hypothetical protein
MLIFNGAGSQGDALNWYALPRWGKWDDHVSDSVGLPRFRCRATTAFPVPCPNRISDPMP